MAVIIGILALLSLTLFGITSTARSEVIHAAETGRGEYERCVFTPGKPEFRYRFDVDEKTGKAKLTELIRLKNNEIIQLAVDYVIIAAESGTDLSSLLTSPTSTTVSLNSANILKLQDFQRFPVPIGHSRSASIHAGRVVL